MEVLERRRQAAGKVFDISCRLKPIYLFLFQLIQLTVRFNNFRKPGITF